MQPYWLFMIAAGNKGFGREVVDAVWRKMEEPLRAPWRAYSRNLRAGAPRGGPRPSIAGETLARLRAQRSENRSVADPRLEAAWRECERRYGLDFELDDFLWMVEDDQSPAFWL